jgi:hypothetical protein
VWIADTCSKHVVMRRGKPHVRAKTAPFPLSAIVVVLLLHTLLLIIITSSSNVPFIWQSGGFTISILKMSSTCAPDFNALSRDAALHR